MLNKTLIFLFILVVNLQGIAQDIKYINAPVGTKILKYNFQINDGVETNDSVLAAEYLYNVRGYCIEENNYDTFKRNEYRYKDDTLLTSIRYFEITNDNYDTSGQQLVIEIKLFYNDQNLLTKIMQYAFNTIYKSTILKYNKDLQVSEKKVKLQDRTTQCKTKKYYTNNLLSKEVKFSMFDRRKTYFHYEYNKSGQLTAYYGGIKKGDRIFLKGYEYNAAGQLVKLSNYECDQFSMEFEYDNQNNKILEKRYLDGLLISKSKYHY